MGNGGTPVARRKAMSAVVAVGVVIAAVSITAACTSGSSDKGAGKLDPSLPADQVLHAAAQSVLAAKGVHVHGTVTSTDASGDIDAVVDGVIRFAPKLAGDLSLTATATATANGDADMTVNRVIYDGTTVYTKAPAGLHAKSAAKPNATWFGTPAAGSKFFGSHFSTGLRDPGGFLSALLAEGTFAKAGAETADGAPAVRYAADFAGQEPSHADVWLNDSGLPVELRLKTAHGLDDLHFTGWGEPVKISAPAADEVMGPTDKVSFSVSESSFTLAVGRLDGASSLPPGATPAACVPFTVTLPGGSGSGASTAAPPSVVTPCADPGPLRFPTSPPLPTAAGKR